MYWTFNSQPVANAVSLCNQGGLSDIFSAALEIWESFSNATPLQVAQTS